MKQRRNVVPSSLKFCIAPRQRGAWIETLGRRSWRICTARASPLGNGGRGLKLRIGKIKAAGLVHRPSATGGVD